MSASEMSDVRTQPVVRVAALGGSLKRGGTQGLQAINTMDFIVRALRAWAVPLVIPVGRSWQSFDSHGRIVDSGVEEQLRGLGAEVVRAPRQIRDTSTCDYAHPEHVPSVHATAASQR